MAKFISDLEILRVYKHGELIEGYGDTMTLNLEVVECIVNNSRPEEPGELSSIIYSKTGTQWVVKGSVKMVHNRIVSAKQL